MAEGDVWDSNSTMSAPIRGRKGEYNEEGSNYLPQKVKGKGKKREDDDSVKPEADTGVARSGRACLACRKLKVSNLSCSLLALILVRGFCKLVTELIPKLCELKIDGNYSRPDAMELKIRLVNDVEREDTSVYLSNRNEANDPTS